MKRLLSIVSVLFTLSACGGTITQTSVDQAPQISSPKTFKVEKNWSLITPVGWKLATHKDPVTEGLNEFLAFSPNKIGRDHMVLSIDSVEWSTDKDGGSKAFALGMKEALEESVNVIKSTELVLQGQYATFVAYVVGDNVAILQLNVAWKERGYLVICGGDLSEATQVVKTCSKAMSSFKLK